MKNILIPIELNNSRLEAKIIDIAISYAKKLNSSCWLVHIAPPDPDFVGLGVGPKYIREALAEELREEHREIQEVSKRFVNEGIKAEGLLIQGATHKMILTEIEKLEIDLLILGNKKHNFLDVFFKGSITGSLVDQSNIPVLLVPDNE